MARLLTTGWEEGDHRAAPLCIPQTAIPTHLTGTPTISTTTVRSGARSLRCNGAQQARFNCGGVGNQSFYHRVYVNFAAFPSATRQVFGRASSTNYNFAVTSGGLPQLRFATTQIGSNGAALSTGVWYRIEFTYPLDGAGSSSLGCELRIDGVTIASEVSTRASASGNVDLGDSTANGMDVFFDDFALNDTSGTNQNSWCEDGKVDTLFPTSDNARVGWVNGAAGTTNLYDAVNNLPPVGVGSATSTATSEIEDPTNNATDTYDANMETLDSVGIPASQVVLAVPQGNCGNSTTTSRTAGIRCQSNPGQGTEATRATGTTAAATFPTGWGTTPGGGIMYYPNMAGATAPVVRVRKGTASTNVLAFDQIGLTVEWRPGSTLTMPPMRPT